MNVVEIFNKTTCWMRNPFYFSKPPKSLKYYNLKSFNEAKDKLKEIQVKPGYAVFFWDRKINYIDHIAIVPKQKSKNLNLLKAKLVHGSPPPIGKSHGPLSRSVDYSGVRVASVEEYLQKNTDIYSRIFVGAPPGITFAQIKKAGEIAKNVGDTGILLGKPAFYSFNILNKILFISWVDYSNYKFAKLSIPYFISKKLLGSYFAWRYTYCGDLVGCIYKKAGIKNIPKAKVLIFSGYRSSTFYEWFRECDSLKFAVFWKEKGKTLF